ncbi:MAG: type II secretion system protein [Candidatus Omnitrophota bacterium]
MKKNTAFTLIELVMVIVLVGIIFGVTAPLMLEVGRNWQLAQGRNELCESAKVAMDRMVREIRQVKDKTSVITATAVTFKFIDVDNNTITFSTASGHLMRTVGTTANQLADNVTAVSFTYYNASESVIASPSVNPSATNIARIVIGLTLSSGSSLSLESGVVPRSLQ